MRDGGWSPISDFSGAPGKAWIWVKRMEPPSIGPSGPQFLLQSEGMMKVTCEIPQRFKGPRALEGGFTDGLLF